MNHPDLHDPHNHRASKVCRVGWLNKIPCVDCILGCPEVKAKPPFSVSSKQQREWSERGSTHSNLSEPLHRLIKEQRERSKRGSTHSNLSEPLRISAQTEQAAVSVV